MIARRMIARRIIRPIAPDSVEPIPDQAIIVAGWLDYIEDRPEGAAPLDAEYVAEMADDGSVVELIDNIPPPHQLHNFAGWKIPSGAVD